MTEQSEALRLADALEEKEYPPRRAAAAELRRLQSLETESKERILRLEGALTKEVAINAQLLKALGNLEEYSKRMGNVASNLAAIAAAERQPLTEEQSQQRDGINSPNRGSLGGVHD